MTKRMYRGFSAFLISWGRIIFSSKKFPIYQDQQLLIAHTLPHSLYGWHQIEYGFYIHLSVIPGVNSNHEPPVSSFTMSMKSTEGSIWLSRHSYRIEQFWQNSPFKPQNHVKFVHDALITLSKTLTIAYSHQPFR